MRELDILLGRYLRQHYAEATDAEKAAFRQLLMLSDPALADYLLRGEPHTDRLIASVIARILGRTDP